MNIKAFCILVSFLLLFSGCGGSDGDKSDDVPVIKLSLNKILDTINTLNSHEYNISGSCSGTTDVEIKISSPNLIKFAECLSNTFQAEFDLSNLDPDSFAVTLKQNGDIVSISNNDLPIVDFSPLPTSPTVEEIPNPSNSNAQVISFNCEEIGQIVLFSGSGIKNSPLPYQCSSIGDAEIIIELVSGIELETNSITVSGFDKNGNPNSSNTSFNLPLDTKGPELFLESTGSLKQGENTAFTITFSDLNLSTEIDYNIEITGAINDTVNCSSNPCIVEHSLIQGQGELIVAIPKDALSDTLGNSSPEANTTYTFNITEAEDVYYNLSVINLETINLGIQTSNNKNWGVSWGDGGESLDIQSGSTEISHTYQNLYSGDITISLPWDSKIEGLYLTDSNLNMSLASMPTDLRHLNVKGENYLTGSTEDFPSNLVSIIAQGSNTISGDIINLPSSLREINVSGNNTLSGDIADFSINMESIIIKGESNLQGRLADLKNNLLVLDVEGENSSDISGSALDIPRNMTVFCNLTTGLVTGNISDFPTALNTLCLRNTNMTGDISLLPQTLIELDFIGNREITGDYDDLPPNLTYLSLSLTGVEGDTDNLPSNLNYLRLNNYGNIIINPELLPRDLLHLYVYNTEEQSSFNGDFSGLPASLETLDLGGLMSISGNLSNLPETIKTLKLNTFFNETQGVSGLLSELPRNVEVLTLYSSNVSGDFTDLPNTVVDLVIGGELDLTVNSINWNRSNPTYNRIILSTEDGLSVLEVDRVLEMMAEITTWGEPLLVDLDFHLNGRPSQAGEEFADDIMDKGVTVRRNCLSCTFSKP